MTQIFYIPKVHCAKCNKPADKVERVHDPRKKRRFIRATCHGQRAETEFVTEPGQTVTLWGAPTA